MQSLGKKFAFTQKNVDGSPDNAGVYCLFDDDEIIYFGRALGDGVTIRSRLQDHLAGRGTACTQKATHYSREVTDAAADREVELLKEYEAEFGKLPRCNQRIG